MGVIVHDDDFSTNTAAEYLDTINAGITVTGGVLRANGTGLSYVVPRRVYDHDSSWGPPELRMRLVLGGLTNNGSTIWLVLRAFGDGNNYVAAIIGASSQSLLEVVGGATVASDSATESVGSASVLEAWAQGADAWVTLDGVEILRITVTTMLGHGSGSLLLDNVAANTNVTVSEWLTEAFIPYIAHVGAAVSGTGNISPTVPSPHFAGDMIFMPVESTGGQAANLGTANGFSASPESPVSTGTTTNGTRLTVYEKIAASSSESGPTVTDPGDHAFCRPFIVRGVDTSAPYDDTATSTKGSASTSASAPSVTTTGADRLILNIIARSDDLAGAGFSGASNAGVEGLIKYLDDGTTSGNGGGYAVFGSRKATAGATGSLSATVTSSINASWTAALKGPASGGPVEETGALTAAGSFGASFVGRVTGRGALVAALGAGATQSGRADTQASLSAAVGAGASAVRRVGARASLVAGVGAGSADAASAAAQAAVSVPAALGLVAAALSQAAAAIQAGLAAGESWAGHAQSAADMAAAGEFGATFEAETTSAQTGAVQAGTAAGASFTAAAQAVASVTHGASLATVIAGIAQAQGALSAGSSLTLAAAALVSAQAAVAVGVALGEMWAGHADASLALAAAGEFGASFDAATQSAQVGALSAGTATAAQFASAVQALGALTATSSFGAAIVAIVNSQADLTAAAQFGATFQASGGDAEILPPAKATITVTPRSRVLRIVPRVRTIRLH